jgi:tripartite ATP-independent transporter DctM subunit
MGIGFLLVVTFVGLLVALLSGMPVAFAIALVGFIPLIATLGIDQAIFIIGSTAHSQAFVYILLSLPLFVFMAEILSFGGTVSDIYDAANKWLNRIPGGLAVASVVACALFGSVCGSGAATAAAIGIIAIPQMLNHSYPKSLVFGTVASSAELGQLIPPSIPLIIFAALSDVSLGKLLIGGIVPGILSTIAMSTYIVIFVKRGSMSTLPPSARFSWRERITALLKIWPVMFLALLVMGTLYGGVCTVTEAAAAGAFGALVITALRKGLSMRMLIDSFRGTVRLTSFIMMIIISANIYGYFLTQAGVPLFIAEILSNIRWPILTLMAIMGLLLFLGCFLDMASIMAITLPLFMPTVTLLGWDGVWFGILFLMNMSIGAITPPVGIHLFVAKSIGDSIKNDYGETDMETIIRGMLPFLAIQIILLILVVVFPFIATWLPNTMLKPMAF